MDQGGSSLGLAPFVRCPVDKLLSMNSVRAFKMILRLFIRTLSEFFCFSRRVPSSGLYGRRSPAQSRNFLIINIHDIGAKVRAVELTGKKSYDPSRILVFLHSKLDQGTTKIYSSRAQRAFIEAFRLQEDLNHCFLVLARMGPR